MPVFLQITGSIHSVTDHDRRVKWSVEDQITLKFNLHSILAVADVEVMPRAYQPGKGTWTPRRYKSTLQYA